MKVVYSLSSHALNFSSLSLLFLLQWYSWIGCCTDLGAFSHVTSSQGREPEGFLHAECTRSSACHIIDRLAHLGKPQECIFCNVVNLWLAGMDKRVYAVDPTHGRTVFHHQLESKALGVLPNPGDFNLIMVQTG